MSIPKKYRGLVVVVAFAFLLGLADKAFSYKLTSFATDVVVDVIAEVAELTAPPPRSPQTAMAPDRPAWDGPRFEFSSAADFPAAFGDIGYGDQPWISLGTPIVFDLDATPAHQKPGPTSTPSFQNPGAGQRYTAPQGMAGSFSPGSGGTSSGGGGPQAEAAGSLEATSLAEQRSELAGSELTNSERATSLAERWSELASSSAPDNPSGSGGGQSRELATDPDQTGADDIGAFGEIQYGPVSPSDLVAPGSLSEALAVDSATGEPATGGPGLEAPTVLKVAAVLDVPGAAPSDVGLEWMRHLESEAALESEGALDLSPAALVGESSSPENAVAGVSEPALLAVFGIGLLAVASRIRGKLRRAR